MTADPISQGLQTLAERFSVDRDQWREHHKGGDALLDGLVSHGYAIHKDGRYAVSRAGRERMAEAMADG